MDMEKLKTSLETCAQWSFSRAGGPGGQNVNKVSTKARLKIQISDLEGLNAHEIGLVLGKLAARITDDGCLNISSSEERSQNSNREKALHRAWLLIIAACKEPKKRKATRPGRSAIEKRLSGKKLESRKKMYRKQIDQD